LESLPAAGRLPAGADLEIELSSNAGPAATGAVPQPLGAGLATPAGAAQQRSAARALYGRAWTAASVGTDALMLGLAVTAALVGAGQAGVDAGAGPGVWLFAPLAMTLMAIRGLYKPRLQIRLLDDVGRTAGCISIAAMAIISITTLSGGSADPAGLMARIWMFSTLYVAGGRLVFGLAQRQARAVGTGGRPTLIVGAGRVAAQVARRLEEQPELGLRPVGFVDAAPADDQLVPGRRHPVLGAPDELDEIVDRTGAEHVILAFLSSRGSDARMVPIVRKCDELGVKVSLVPRLFENINVRAELEHLGGMPLFGLSPIRPKSWHFAVKHGLDRVAAATLVVLLAPLLLATALAIKLSSPGPVLFRQNRVGRDGREFDLFKFRTMSGDPVLVGEADAAWAAATLGGVEAAGAPTEDRRTRVGSLLRRYSLDEIPQLFNVLKGEMSLVGPRPERSAYVRLFEDRIYRYGDRHRVKSGLTGWAQVHGLRGQTCLSDRIEWDNFYIENWSLWLDLKILIMTLAAVCKQAE
jgi:exopolysaccharide biosynthesis polyprenyl glycosylphosphotransferase